jgi:phosphoglycolate phosphatase
MNNPPSGSAVIFDLDGTLVDSAPDIAASVDYALTQIGRSAPSLAQVRNYIGNGADRLLHRSLTFDLDGIADDALFESANRHFLEHYRRNVCCRSAPYPGVIETLTTLTEHGYFLACVTNKPARFTDPLLEELGLDGFFSVTLSGDSLELKKPAPDQLLHVADRCAIATHNCTMVGDTVTDILAAQNASMGVVCVSYGYGDIADIVAHNPSAIIDSIDQIVNLVATDTTAPSRRVGMRI